MIDVLVGVLGLVGVCVLEFWLCVCVGSFCVFLFEYL